MASGGETASMHCSMALSGRGSFAVSRRGTGACCSRRYCRHGDTFTVGRYVWEVTYYPNGHDGGGGKCSSVFLKLHNLREREQVRASIAVGLHRPSTSADMSRSNFSHTFTLASPSGGISLLRLGLKDGDEPAPASGQRRRRDDGAAVDTVVVKCAVDMVVSLLVGDAIVPPSDLREHIGSLLVGTTRGAAAPDTTVRVGNRSFKAHRCVLAARSPVLEAQLYGAMKESKKRSIRVHDMDARVFEAMLHFMYHDALPAACIMDGAAADGQDDGEGEDGVAGKITTKDLLVAVNLYGMERLKLICEEKLSQGLDAGTVADRLEFAKDYYCEHLKSCCLKYMELNGGVEASHQ